MEGAIKNLNCVLGAVSNLQDDIDAKLP